MSQTDNEPGAPTGGEEHPGAETFTLQVVSPSAGITGPLNFSQLPTQTTVKQLKEKIRESLPVRPSDDRQRLIHRGRLLARETETMIEVFGQETLKTSELQTIHLVLRPSTADSVPAHTTTAVPNHPSHPVDPPIAPHPFQGIRIPTPPRWPPPPPPDHRSDHLGQPPAPGPFQAQAIRIPTPPQWLPSPSPPPQRILSTNEQAAHTHQQQHHHHHRRHDPQVQSTMQMMQQLQQEHARFQDRLAQQPSFPGLSGTPLQPSPGQSLTAMPSFQNLIAQHQRDRAAMGMQGAQQGNSNTFPQAGQSGHPQSQGNRAVHRPNHTRTSTHDIQGPNGERWRVTVNETTTVFPHAHLSHSQARNAHEASQMREIPDMVQNIARAVDATATTQQVGGLSHETTTLPNLSSPAGLEGGINRPASLDNSVPIHATMANSPTSSEHLRPTTNISSNAYTPAGPLVYVLSSPTGPQALLVSPSDNGSPAFYTTRQPLRFATPHQNQRPQNQHQAQTDAATRREARNHRHARRQADARGRAAPGLAHPPNPPAAAAAARIWPHIWLIVRLMGFVWFFTSGNSSWWRTIMVSGLAFIFFIASTGILNGIAEQMWGPIRRHLESLLPLAGLNGQDPTIPANNPAAVPVQGQAVEVADTGVAAAQAPPGPAQAAARLLEQRRIANGNWLWTQVRRAEHATILFLASLVPGVGERHIAARAAEENLVMEAQRQRQEAAAAEAAREGAAEAVDAAEGAADTADLGEGSGVVSATTGNADVGGHAHSQSGGENSARNHGNAGADGAEIQPLIQV